MSCILSEAFSLPDFQRIVRERLPKLFHMAEIESSRDGKVGMEVGSLRETILIALLVSYFGENNVIYNIPIVSSELDVRLFGAPVSIKTKTGNGFGGIKAVWTVDPIKVRTFIEHYQPECDILLAQLVWGGTGWLYYLPLEAQKDSLDRVGVSAYLRAPKPGTNPMGVEFQSSAMELVVWHQMSKRIPIIWRRPSNIYDKYDRWIKFWKENI
jgi:hypothetical protein